MNMTKHEDARPMLSGQIQWFMRAIAVAAWRWRKPFTFLAVKSAAEDAAQAREECLVLINALTYGVLEPAFYLPVDIEFNQIFDVFFASSKIDEMDSTDLVKVLADAFGEAVEG